MFVQDDLHIIAYWIEDFAYLQTSFIHVSSEPLVAKMWKLYYT